LPNEEQHPLRQHGSTHIEGHDPIPNLENIGVITPSAAQWAWLAGIVAWTNWSPTYGGGGSMTYTSVTTTIARYCQIGKIVFFVLDCFGTTGGTADPHIEITLPSTPSQGSYSVTGGAVIYDGAELAGSFINDAVAGTIRVSKYDDSNWGLGPNKYIRLSGHYEVS